MLIDVTCPFDTRFVQKDIEKIDHYNYELTYEIRRIWNCKKVLIIANVIGVFRPSITKLLWMYEQIRGRGEHILLAQGMPAGHNKKYWESAGYLREPIFESLFSVIS